MVHGELGPHQEGSIEVGEAGDFQQGGDTPYGVYLLLRGQGFLCREENKEFRTPKSQCEGSLPWCPTELGSANRTSLRG